jgi:hypothetical protein
MVRRRAKLTSASRSPHLLECLFSEVCAFFLLSDNGNRAVGVPNHGLRYAAHKRPP